MQPEHETRIEAARRRRPLEAAAIAKMTPEQRAQLAGMIGEAMARRDNRRDMVRIVLVLLTGVAMLGGIALYAG